MAQTLTLAQFKTLLRAKLNEAGGPAIVAVRGVGYRVATADG